MSSRRGAGVLLFFAALTALFTLPLSLSPGSRAIDLGADTRLFLWTLSWDVHALVGNASSLFQANIFYPQPDTLAYSEHLLGSALLAAPWLAVSDNPVLALNAVLLVSCVGAGVATYYLARQIGIGATGALAAGVVFAFAPPRFFRLGQLHLANVMWMPLCLAWLHRYAGSGSLRHLLVACVFFTLQALSGGQAGLFLLLTAAGFLVYAWGFGLLKETRPQRLLSHLGIATVLLVAWNVPFLLPYLRVQQEAGLRRSLHEAREWSPNAASFLAAPTHVQRTVLGLYPGLERRVLGTARAYLFPGFLTLLLAGLALRRTGESPPAERAPPSSRAPRWLAWLDGALVVVTGIALLLWLTGGVRWHVGGLTVSARGADRALALLLGLLVVRFAAAGKASFRFVAPCRRGIRQVRAQLQARMGLPAGFYLLVTVLSLWIALGPRFGLYSVLHRVVPGFDFIRVPSRFTLVTVLALSVLAGVGLERCLRAARSPRGRRMLATGLVGGLALEFAAFPLDAPAYSLAIPSVDRWIAEKARAEGPFAVVELPVPDPRDAARSARWHSIYMIHSTAHWQRLVNGYSGFTPAEQDALFRKLVSFPNPASLDALERLGVRYAVIHRDAYGSGEWDEVETKLDAFAGRLRLETRKDGDSVYTLTRRSTY